MKTWQLIIIITLLVTALTFIIPKSTFTGKVIDNGTFSYTRAICNESNFCEDYIVECEKFEMKKLTPTGFTVQKERDWEDNRSPKENLCK